MKFLIIEYSVTLTINPSQKKKLLLLVIIVKPDQ